MVSPFTRSSSRLSARRATDSDSPNCSIASSRQSTPKPETLSGSTRSSTLPAFLCQSSQEIDLKYDELNELENDRIIHGRKYTKSPWTQSSSTEISKRNRYLAVQPWDQSRVRLKVSNGICDYINASPIILDDPASTRKLSFIATQGPMRSGLFHFWHMMWHEMTEVAVIVMLTQTEEAGREKCYQYFPLDEFKSPLILNDTDGNETSLAIALELREDGHGPHTQVRKLLLRRGSVTKTVWHLLFTAFPDFGVPSTHEKHELLHMIKLSHEKQGGSQSPKVVHCSAGVGRSGTFIALDYLLALLGTGNLANTLAADDPIDEIVHRLREQRMMMVQSEVQFHFLYDIMRDIYRNDAPFS